MPRHIIYIINPISGTRKKSGLQKLIEEKTAQKNIPFKIFPSVASGDYSFLVSIIQEEKITDVIVAGGDGTLSQVVGSLMNENVNFGVIPCGSGNGLALTAGISKEPLKALEIIFNNKAKAIDGFYINDHFSCMLTGIGFDAKVAHEFAKHPKRGLRTYAILVGKNFFSAKPYHFTIESNGLTFSTDAYFISIANSNQFGNNFTIAPKALLSDGLLDVVIVKKTAKPILLYNLIKQILAGKLQKMETSLKLPVIYFQTNQLSIENNSYAPMHIDGDPFETPDKLKIKIVPKCFRLIQPL
ncbi:MAG TPA: YegS/Rv2252/BmrU family lipid kinase [Chitinophagaceae bacterium]|jgi:YegS/Rv2252/BmrU family lipid kinase|nr:YegS/Rv2252/BmrU family lipid kinase [Chitinophagaceae bacterium]